MTSFVDVTNRVIDQMVICRIRLRAGVQKLVTDKKAFTDTLVRLV
jgi:hypothetical protein